MDKGPNATASRRGDVQHAFEAMPEDSVCQGEPVGDRPRGPFVKSEGCLLVRMSRKACAFFLLAMLLCVGSVLAPTRASAQTVEEDRKFDIGIVIDNRTLPRSEAARADVDRLIESIDLQMHIEHVMVFERPTIEVVCDVVGCQESIDPDSPFPPLLWQITRREKARIFVYYIGPGRAEGLERQLLFQDSDGATVGLSVDWLHVMLEEAEPKFAALMLDTSFAPRRLPCADDDPRLISDALLDIRQNYLRIARDRWNRSGVIELSATTPVEPAHCDRFDLLLEGIQQPMFTKFFLKGVVDGEADEEPFGDEDGLIDLGELSSYLDDRISRAARFHWGRRQNVRTAGSRGRALASVEPRGELRQETKDLIARRNRAPAEAAVTPSGLENPDQERDAPGGDAPSVSPEAVEPRCGEDSTADDCHPCVLDPGGAACIEHCQEDTGSDFCARFLTTSTEPGADMADSGADSGEGAAGGVEVVPLDEGDGQRSAACGFVAETIAPYAAVLVQRIQGEVEPSCNWADDRSHVERGPFAQIFTPVAWRLSRTSAQDAVHCLLDCENLVASNDRQIPEAAPLAPQVDGTVFIRTPVDPRTYSAFNLEICDRLHEPLPPYIGIPRWMPGTLMMSEALRATYGCPPPAAEPVLPTPLAVAIAPPPPGETPGTDAPENPTPAVADADDRLSTWPPSTADIDTSPGEREPLLPTPEVEIADATSLEDADDADAPDVPDAPGEPDVPAPPAEPPFVATEGKVHWLQSALTVGNRNPGPIDGAMGPRTMAAVQSWRRDNGRENRTGALTEPEFQAIIKEFGERFQQVQARIGAI